MNLQWMQKWSLFVLGLLCIPLIAMQFTTEVNWGIMDFLVAGILLFGVGLLFDFMLRKTNQAPYRVLYIIAISLLFLLIWAELAVGILGTPFAGN